MAFTFLALGDSYTIGEAVSEEDRWPVQLVSRLSESGINVSNPEIIATTGWATGELLKGIENEKITETFDLVSLLIGVNNQYRGDDPNVYKKEFVQLLEQAIGFAGGHAKNIFVISIPDYGGTPFAETKKLDAEKITTELTLYNAEAKLIADSRGVAFFDITEWSRNATHIPSLVASDGLHPSGEMYKNWVDTCYEWVHENLSVR